MDLSSLLSKPLFVFARLLTRRPPLALLPDPLRSMPVFHKPRLFVPILLLVMAAPAPPAHAQLSEAVQYFDEGNRLYAQGNYSGALTAFDRAVAAGYVSGALFYNMGNAYYRIDQIGQAIRYYEKARRLTPGNERVSHNMAMARARMVDSFSELPEPFWRPAWRTVMRTLGAGGLFFGGLILYLVAAAFAGQRIWTGTRSDWRRRGLTASSVGAALLILLAFAASIESERDRDGVIVARQVALLDAPAAGARADIDIHEGVLVKVIGQSEEYVEVRLPNGAAGWVKAEAVAPI